MSTGPLKDWLERLSAAENLVEVARAVFALANPRGLGFELLDAAGAPLVTISNVPFVPAQWARNYLRGAWRSDPSLAAVRARHAVVAFTDLVPLEVAQQMTLDVHGPDVPIDLVGNLLVGPICGNGRVIGTLRLVANEPVSPAIREVAHAVCTHTAVRLAELGLAGPDHVERLAQLTTRQREVARLVARGRSTSGIADALVISPNTVKKHLKDIFEQLGVTSRAELAVVVSRFGASITELETAYDDLIVVWREPEHEDRRIPNSRG